MSTKAVTGLMIVHHKRHKLFGISFGEGKFSIKILIYFLALINDIICILLFRRIHLHMEINQEIDFDFLLDFLLNVLLSIVASISIGYVVGLLGSLLMKFNRFLNQGSIL